MTLKVSALTVVAGLAVCCLGVAPATREGSATRPAATATTQGTITLTAEIQRAVEVAQRGLRAPARAGGPAPRNTVERAERRAAVSAASDPLKEGAAGLVGKEGVVAFRVVDVVPNDGRHVFTGGPPGMDQAAKGSAYVVEGEVENVTATYYTDAQRREIHAARVAKDARRVALVEREAASAKPACHRVWLATSDGAVRAWGAGERRSVRGVVLAAGFSLSPFNRYVRAAVVVRADRVAGGGSGAVTRPSSDGG